ncbi:MAG TPA: 16S rRNA (guanine(527)-N(7))-methyltransferase RsmG [Chloroflexi bacterium]|jgi:16S rRNA (guanine527-N7)-methyltransferase|nr:16S rRNA (guanine(527)-N(7))-methyltransferase RsmG [Chloroflexota bacterium]
MELLREGAKDLGLTLSPGHIDQFERYYQELRAWNQRFNLTAITGYQEVQIKHFLDSLTCLLAFPRGAGDDSIPDTVPVQIGSRSLWCVDVGSGAGFPGLPIKIMLPEAEVTLIEATGKKVTFLQHMVRVLGLEHVNVLRARAEEVGRLPEHRERYDIVVARAVAHLGVLAEYCLPLLRVGGRMIAPKGEEADKEAEAAGRAVEVLGGRLVGVKPVHLPGIDSERYLVVVDKVGKTPDDYPRRTGIPSKRPLQNE